MVKQAKKIIFVLFSTLLMTDMLVFAQQSMTITTYYPPPVGAYDRLRLIPSKPIDPIPACSGPTDWGSIYFDGNSPQSLQMCINDGTGGGVWGSISGSSSGAIIWDRDAVNGRVYLHNNGDFVGLGTTTPEFQLTLNGDGGILAKGTFNAGALLTTANAGTRLIWYPRKAAFRAGMTWADEWNDVNIGDYSTAYGTSRAIATWATAGGGSTNRATAQGATVAGGNANVASGINSFVGSGEGNVASGNSSVIIGGGFNQATNQMTTIGSGGFNQANGLMSTIGSGSQNTVDGDYAGILNGYKLNSIAATGDFSFIGGGANNTANGLAAVVAGGGDSFYQVIPTWGNQANGNYSFIGGGQNNRANGTLSVIGGGGGTEGAAAQGNQSTGPSATIVGGRLNFSSNFDTVVGGGENNRSTGVQSTVGGGQNNQATNISSVVSGGGDNQATGFLSIVGGGQNNLASEFHTSVAGGQANTSSRSFSSVSGGNQNATRGFYCWAGGRGMDISNTGFATFAWGYSAAPFNITPMNSFLIFPNYVLPNQGSVGINTPTATTALDVNGSAKFLGLLSGGTNNVTIDTATGILYRTVSSKRYKNNIRTLSINPDKVFDLKPVQFAYKASGNKDIGFIAEEVESNIPDLVLRDDAGQPEAVRYEKVSIYLLEAAKELSKESDQLRKENDLLKKRIQTLKKAKSLE